MLDTTIKHLVSRVIETLGRDWADVDISRTKVTMWVS